MMKSVDEKVEKPVQVRRYSDHPIIQKKVAEAREFLEKANLSFMDKLPVKKK